MKNIVKLSLVISSLILASCSSAPKEETQTPPPAVNETTIIHAETKEPVKETKSTEVTINKDGSSFETKDGGKGTKVEVSKDKAEIIIKK